ncbi:acetylornithine deacetylase [Candidatus Tenderia electrophaga]|jgi:acetylornithine deacetylase|uniref:Acetylornithine deacetylase n=1 Tax=Candidatus Tenderia electrophaga TaxID=1748243 RepID=A0A0S2TGI6_9GAMM|nr:acetylornithine deacetylase [Candidatus Tenderia electrophaga]
MTTQRLTLNTMLRQLIATPSMSSVSPEFDTSNRAVIELLATWLEDAGFQVEVYPLPQQPGKANLLASYGRVEEHSQGLMLAGHTDTVPYDQHSWHHDPFQLTERDNRLYGLGTSDMKSFFALAIEAARRFRPQALTQPLFILATADEESSMEGALALVQRGCPHVRYAVIGEPTGLTPVNAHKGIMMEAIRLTGRSGHSSNPAMGVNALEAMHMVIADLLQWRAELQARFQDKRFSVPVPTLNLGHIHGGDNPNRICEQCELHFDLRALPGMDLDELRQQLRARLHSLFRHSAVRWQLLSLSQGTPPLHTDSASPIVQAAEHLCHHASRAVAFCTEGPYLTELGIDTIILGPGDIEQAHQPDEYLALDRIDPTVELLSRLIRNFCT